MNGDGTQRRARDWSCSDAHTSTDISVRVACSASMPCAAGEYCDALLAGCYPTNGECRAHPCRPLNPKLKGIAQIRCDSSEYCRLSTTAPLVPVGLSAPISIEVKSPTAGQSLPVGSPVSFQWAPLAHAAIVLVLNAPPATKALGTAAMWGATVDPGVTAISWSAGHKVSGTSWSAPPDPTPEETALYLFIEEVNPEGLVAISPIVPFSVGQAWRATGAPCADEGVVAGECAHPSLVRVCRAGTCRVLCESNLDCLPSHCEIPDESGLRVCGAI